MKPKTITVFAQLCNMLPRIRRKKYRCLFLDVDSTYIKLYGNQEKKSYNGHYQCCCLAPVLCYLHGYPIAVYGVAGTSYARKVLEHYLPRQLKRIQKAFPDYIIVLRADSGFNSNALIETCQKLGAHYIMGFPPIKAAQQAIYSKGLNASKPSATRLPELPRKSLEQRIGTLKAGISTDV